MGVAAGVIVVGGGGGERGAKGKTSHFLRN